MYDHGKLDLKFVRGSAIAEENSKSTSFREKSLFSCEHICFDKQLLPQINICCEEIIQNNEMTSLMTQSLLDACDILKSDYQVAVLAFNSKS